MEWLKAGLPALFLPSLKPSPPAFVVAQETTI